MIEHKKSSHSWELGSTAASVEAVEIPQGPLPVTLAGADHWNVPLRIERPNAAKLQRQSIQTAESGTTEPSAIWASVELHATIKTI